MSHRILRSMGTKGLLDVPGAGGRPAPLGPYVFDGVGSARSSNPGTLKSFMARKGARYSYTLEAPTRIDPERQVRGSLRLLESALHNIHRHGDLP